MSPRSTATNTVTSPRQGIVPSRGRIHTSAAAPAQNANAMSVASRTVDVMPGVADTPAKTLTSDAGAANAQIHRAATIPKGTAPVIRSNHRIGSLTRCSSARSIQAARSTHNAVATVIMLRLCRRWWP